MWRCTPATGGIASGCCRPVPNSMRYAPTKRVARMPGGTVPEMMTLHSKATIIDRKTIFVGSLNFDPRSILINSEMGIFIESDYAASGLAAVVFDELSRVAYKVDLDERGQAALDLPVWRATRGSAQVTAGQLGAALYGRILQSAAYRKPAVRQLCPAPVDHSSVRACSEPYLPPVPIDPGLRFTRWLIFVFSASKPPIDRSRSSVCCLSAPDNCW